MPDLINKTAEVIADGDHVIRTLDRTGDSRFSWNPADTGEVEAAREHFGKLRAKGYLLYRTDGADRGEQLHAFDPSASEIIATAALVGG